MIERLNWMRDVLGPMLRDAMNIIGEIDLRLMLARAAHGRRVPQPQQRGHHAAYSGADAGAGPCGLSGAAA